jgi:hypothetical protein
MSIATKRGDGGQTGLAGGIRISKADLRVEAYGTVDELNTVLGFARSICTNKEICDWTETIQRTLFRVGSALATPPESKKTPPSRWFIRSKRPTAFSLTGRCRAHILNRLPTRWRGQCAAGRSALPYGSLPAV